LAFGTSIPVQEGYVTRPSRVLIVDDEPEIGALFLDLADGLGLEATYIERSVELVETFRAFRPDVIVLDLMMPDSDGVEVLRSLAAERCSAEILLFSGADNRVMNTVARLGETHGLRIAACLQKPLSLDEIEAALSGFVTPQSAERDLRAAIEDRQIVAFYQPKVTLSEKNEWVVESVEALARWVCPRRGLVSPVEFIPVAEETGLIKDLTAVIVDDALRTIAEVRRHGYNLRMSVNLSPLLLDDPTCPDRLGAMVREHEVNAQSLVVEITESAAMSDPVLAIASLTQFRRQGMGLSIDDFGTGYSSLVQLHQMPFSELKVDRSFVSEVDRSEDARIIVRSIVELAHGLDLTVCAEGVETKETMAFLTAIGCDQAQGFLVAKPMSAGDLLDFLTADRSRRVPPSVAVGSR
jgi:EAL domain-containing protein (putative c-di-GMP-specific phosphodiesterase class I)